MPRSGFSARRPNISHSLINLPILEADVRQGDRDEDVLAFRDRSFPDDLIELHRTDELWEPKKLQPATDEGAPRWSEGYLGIRQDQP